MSTRGNADFEQMTPEELLESALELLHTGGPEAVPDKLRASVLEEEVRRLSDPDDGLVYFATHYGMVWVKGQGWERFCPGGLPRVSVSTGRDWRWQPAFWSLLTKFYILLIIKARQLGLTFSCSMVALWAAQWLGLRQEQVIAVVTNKMTNSKRLVRRGREMYRKQPTWLNALSPMVNDGITRIEFENGSSIEPFAGNEDASRAEAASLVLVDEVGKITNLDEVFASLEACADNGGRILMWGTANERESGVGSVLHQWVVDAASGDTVDEVMFEDRADGSLVRLPVYASESDMRFIFLPWHLHADRDQKWYEKKRRLYKGNLAKFDAEYPNNWESAFIGSGTAYFDYAALQRQLERASARDAETGLALFEVRDRRGTFLWVDRERRHVKFVEDPYGDVTLHFPEHEYAEIMGKRRPFVIPADCRGDGAEGDYNAAHAIRVGRVPIHADDVVPPDEFLPWEQFATIHGHMDPDQYAEQLVRMGWYFGGALISPEMNGVGVATARAVRRLGYPYLYSRRTRPDQKGEKATRLIGWYSSEATKNAAYGETERLLRNDFLVVRDPRTIGELLSVRMLGGGRLGAPPPKHDDLSDALTIGSATGLHAHNFDHKMSLDRGLRDEFAIDDILAELEAAERSSKYLGAEQQSFMGGR